MRCRLLPSLLLSFLACQTSREQADTAVSRSKQVNPRSVKQKEQHLKPHKSLPRDRLTETLTRRYAELLPGLAAALIRHPTFVDPRAPEAEPKARDAFLATLHAQADQLGLAFRQVTPLAVEIELPSEPPGATRVVGLLAHGDVVPPGDGWTVEPFGARVKDGRLYGRGAMDDKGPLVASLVALAAVRDAQVPRPFVTRLIVGMAEETSWDCIRGYLGQRPAPDFTIVVDGAFPVSVGEKGLASIKVAERQQKATPAAGRCLLTELDGGSGGTSVPAAASAVITCADNPQDVAKALSQLPNLQVGIRGLQLRVTSEGKTAPGDNPEGGINAILQLCAALDGAGHLDDDAPGTQLVRFLSRGVGNDTQGETLGIAGSRAGFTPTTVNLGKVRSDNGLFVASLTVRFVPRSTVEDVVGRVRSRATDFVTRSGRPMRLIVDGNGLPPSEVDPDRPEVAALLRAYEAVMDRPPTTVTTVGTTYAKALPNAVAFGPEEEGEPERHHTADEFITTEELFTLSRVYAQALSELGQPDGKTQTDTKPR